MHPNIEKSEITKIYTLFFALQASSKTKKLQAHQLSYQRQSMTPQVKPPPNTLNNR